MTGLAEACGELGAWLAIAETLTAIPDIQPSARPPGKPGTRLPGNPAAFHAVMDAHCGVRQLEAGLRSQVSGTVTARGGSDANTAAALEAIPVLAGALPVQHTREEGRCSCLHCDAARVLGRWAVAIQQLPAIDTVPRWIPIRPGPEGLPPRCPWCKTFSLRLSVEYGQVRCVYPRCTDDDGHRPSARLEYSRIDGKPILAWSSGLVQ